MEAATVRKALVVDDDPDMRQLIRAVLEIEGDFICDEAADVMHALEQWHVDEHDVVVTDLRMPEVSGLELAEALLAENPNQIVILCSAYLEAKVLDRAHAVGVCAVLSKDEIRRLPALLGEVFAESA